MRRVRNWLYRYAWQEDPTPESASPALRQAQDIEDTLMQARRWRHDDRRFSEMYERERAESLRRITRTGNFAEGYLTPDHPEEASS